MVIQTYFKAVKVDGTVVAYITKNVNPYPTKLIHLNFLLLEVVSRYRDQQLQVA